MSNYSYKYPLLNDKEWLYQKYINEKLSTEQILKLVGCKTANSVRQSLIRFDIEVRTRTVGLTCNRVNDGFNFNQEVIYGCLLGDGGLSKWNKFSDESNPFFRKRNKFKDHIEHIANLLGLNENSISYEYVKSSKSNTMCDVYTLKSASYKELLPIYKKWYPESNDFKKIVPNDIIITPTVLLHWFMDDGCTWYRKDRKNTPIVGSFSSESFTKEENMMLIEKIKDSTGLLLTPQKCNSGTESRISIPTSQIKAFFEVIGNCPVNSLEYKWKG